MWSTPQDDALPHPLGGSCSSSASPRPRSSTGTMVALVEPSHARIVSRVIGPRRSASPIPVSGDRSPSGRTLSESGGRRGTWQGSGGAPRPPRPERHRRGRGGTGDRRSPRAPWPCVRRGIRGRPGRPVGRRGHRQRRRSGSGRACRPWPPDGWCRPSHCVTVMDQFQHEPPTLRGRNPRVHKGFGIVTRGGEGVGTGRRHAHSRAT